MIKSFIRKETEKIWSGEVSHRLPKDIQERILRKLRQLDASQTLEDLRHPPGNRLESLKGNRSNQMSIQINQRWRLCFIWENSEAYEVEVIDYH